MKLENTERLRNKLLFEKAKELNEKTKEFEDLNFSEAGVCLNQNSWCLWKLRGIHQFIKQAVTDACYKEVDEDKKN